MRDEYIYRERQLAWGPMLGLALAVGVGLPLHLAFDPGAELRVVRRDGKRFRLGSADVAGLRRMLAPRL